MQVTSEILKYDTSLKDYVAARIKELKQEHKRLEKRYFFWSSILLALNICSIVLSIVGIVYIADTETTNAVYAVLTALAAAIVIVIFVLHSAKIVFWALMRHKYYLKGTELIQNEYFQYQHNQYDYKDIKNRDAKLKLLEENVNKIFKDAMSHKRHKNKYKLAFRALVGGEDA